MHDASHTDLLARIERCYDAIPRYLCDAEPTGPLVVFVPREPGWSYYVRPTVDGGPVSVADVRAARARRRELGQPEAFEWVHDVTPSLRPAAVAAGLVVHDYPLMVLRDPVPPSPLPRGIRLAEVDPDDPDLARAVAVANVAFGSPGTAVGEPGPAARDVVAAGADARPSLVALRAGWTVMWAAYDGAGPLSVGSAQSAAGGTEVVGVGTLPAARRQGLGGAVTAALVQHAVDAGTEVVFLAADDEDVARVYARLGFQRIGTACIAEAAP